MTIDDKEKDYTMQLLLIIAVVALIGIMVWLVTMPRAMCDIIEADELCSKMGGTKTQYNDGLYCSASAPYFAYHLDYYINGSCYWKQVS